MSLEQLVPLQPRHHVLLVLHAQFELPLGRVPMSTNLGLTEPDNQTREHFQDGDTDYEPDYSLSSVGRLHT